MGRRQTVRQGELFVPSDQLPQAPRNAFFERLNALFAEHDFDTLLEDLCRPYYAKAGSGRPGIPPGVYFRMLLVGYFEGLDSQRLIAWRCEDSLSLRKFLGYSLTEETPDHSSLTRIRQRLPLQVHEQIFILVLKIVEEELHITGLNVGVDSTTLEANAAMRKIVHKDSGDTWKEYIRGLMIEAGEIGPDDQPSSDDIQRFDRKREDKQVSNTEWESPTDPDSRIIKMKDGRTHLGYKAEHVVDLESEVILHAEVFHGTDADSHTIVRSVIGAQANLDKAGTAGEVFQVAADNGYYSADTLADLESLGLEPYLAEKPSQKEKAIPAGKLQWERERNRERCQSGTGRALQRQRSEKVERSFAHCCNTGSARRTHLRGLESINTRYLIHTAAYNLGIAMRKLLGAGTPRQLTALWAALCALGALLLRLHRPQTDLRAFPSALRPARSPTREKLCFDSYRVEMVPISA